MSNDVIKLIMACRVNLDNIIERCNDYIILHDEYIISAIKDSDELKKMIKEKVIGVLNEDN
jgi:hypothetical protein